MVRGPDSALRLLGAALALLALDQTRRYLVANYAGTPDVGLFFTNLVTQSCVPVVVFLAGLMIALYHGPGAQPGAISRWLVPRAFLLIALDLTVVRIVAWFTVGTDFIGVLGLLWAVGASMIVLAVLVHLPRRDLVAFAVVVIALHNLLDDVMMPGAQGLGTAPGPTGKLWVLLHQSGDIFRVVGTTGPQIAVAVPVLPLAGVMAAGYAFGALWEREAARRIVWLRRWGFGLVAAFFVLRGFNIHGDPGSWSVKASPMAGLVSFLDLTRFPASLALLLLALGSALVVLALLEAGPAWLRPMAVFGRAPLFFYIAQILTTHAIALAVTAASGRDTSHLFVTRPFEEGPFPEASFTLGVVYACWLIALAILFPICRTLNRPPSRESPECAVASVGAKT
jgi:uncharacterized membrane protein